MSTVFSNYRTKKPTKDNVIRDAKPSNGPHRWHPNRDFYKLVQPNEKGNFFSRVGKSGAGAVAGEVKIGS